MFVVKIIRVDEIERLCHCGGMPTAVFTRDTWL